MRRSQVHIYGIAEFRQIGTVMANDSDAWRVETASGVIVRATKDPPVQRIEVGNRVEIEPRFQSTTGSRLNLVPNWIIVRKL